MILGFSEGFHDAAVAIVDYKGNIEFAAHSERSSGIKHDKRISQKLYDQIAPRLDIERCAFYENPLLKRTRQLFAGQYKTALSPRNLTFHPDKCYSHHLSHAAAAFQTSNYREAACVVVDSIGEWDTVSVWSAHYDRDGFAQYKKVWSRKYPFSVGLWYSALTKYVGLKPLDEEYIFMGMAPFGKFNHLMHEALFRQLHDENNHRGIRSRMSEDFTDEEIAYNAQVILEEHLMGIFAIAREYSDNICYGGGVALNCVANGKLMDFHKNLWVMPNPGDAGAALGAAALQYGKKLNWVSPYLGENIDRPIDPTVVASYIIEHGICGVANGRAEFGPRALGNRSLLANPMGADMKDRVNEIKQRQKFRPFAPAILSEHAQNYFDGNLTRYMSTTARCKFPEQFPAIVHIDGTSRVQVVHPDDPTPLRGILEAFYARTGCPMLLNTSLNVRGKPMVDTWDDAMEFEKLYGVKVF